MEEMNDLTFSGLLLLKPLNGDEIPKETSSEFIFLLYSSNENSRLKCFAAKCRIPGHLNWSLV